MDEPM